MLVQIIIGAVAMLGFVLLLNWFNRNNIKLNWWQWILTILGVVYAVFVLEVIVIFMVERVPQGAAFMGGITAVIGVIYAILLQRFVYTPSKA